MVSPYLRVRYPVPPPSVSPATPVLLTMPNGTASPKPCVAWSTSAELQPGSTRTVFLPGSTRTLFINDRSMTRPSLQLPSPGPLWPPPRMASSRPCSRAKFTAVMTSAVSTARAIRLGRLSIMPL